MKTENTRQQSLQISQEEMLALVRAMIGGSRGREDDDHPLPPGPWDSIIRIALERTNVFGPHPESWDVYKPVVFWRRIEMVFGPLPDPWKIIFSRITDKYPAVWDIIGGGHSFGDEVALNPQPLPPRYAFLAALVQTVAGRAQLFQEITDAARHESEQQGIIIVSGYIARFVDDFCGNDVRFKWPFPGPRPNWFAEEVSGIDLVVMATQFDQAANGTFNPDLRQNLMDAGAKLAEAGLSKMQ
ncbi:MAG: hypothetical protein AB8I58_20030 [Anaerolineales bacterium]|jgi:hypothetical protein